MFVTVQHKHSNRPFDSMNIWLEEVKADGFVVCLREFMSFDGIHTGLKVVSFKKFSPVFDKNVFLCPFLLSIKYKIKSDCMEAN